MDETPKGKPKKERALIEIKVISKALPIIREFLADTVCNYEYAPGVIYVRRKMPWDEIAFDRDSNEYPYTDSRYHRRWDSIDYIKTRDLFETSQKLTFDRKVLEEAVSAVASENRINPIAEHLLNLHWDGQPRLNTWLEDYCCASTNPPQLLTHYGRKFILGMVARGLNPGYKFDQMLILEGSQGTGKSTLCKLLAGGDKFFSDALPDLRDSKKVVESYTGKMLVEIGELSSFTRADQRLLKGFISRTVDSTRLSYAKDLVEFPRSFVFIGTTNEVEGYLIDETGNRRIWSITCNGPIDIPRIRLIRDQLLAEAVVALNDEGETPELDPDMYSVARESQSKKLVSDEALEEFLLENWYMFENVMDGERRVKSGWLIKYIQENYARSVHVKAIALSMQRLGAESTRTMLARFWKLPETRPHDA